MDPMDLADDDDVAVVSNMGAPLVGQERLTDPRTIARAVTMMEEYLGRPFRAIMSLEIGGGNAIQPFMAAALLNRPVVDADCMGRAFPEAQMTSFAIHDLPMYPAHAGRRARQRRRRRARRLLEVDGAPLAHGVRRGRLDRRHLQGAAHRQGESRSARSSTRRARRSGSARRSRPPGAPIAIRSRR